VTDSKLLQKFPAFTEPKTEMKSRVQNARKPEAKGLEMDMEC